MYSKLLLIIFCSAPSLYLSSSNYAHTHTQTFVCIFVSLVSGCCWLTPISEAASEYTSIDESSQINCVYCWIESILLQKEKEREREKQSKRALRWFLFGCLWNCDSIEISKCIHVCGFTLEAPSIYGLVDLTWLPTNRFIETL